MQLRFGNFVIITSFECTYLKIKSKLDVFHVFLFDNFDNCNFTLSYMYQGKTATRPGLIIYLFINYKLFVSSEGALYVMMT